MMMQHTVLGASPIGAPLRLRSVVTRSFGTLSARTAG